MSVVSQRQRGLAEADYRRDPHDDDTARLDCHCFRQAEDGDGALFSQPRLVEPAVAEEADAFAAGQEFVGSHEDRGKHTGHLGVPG
jgi:hypothetical protein